MTTTKLQPGDRAPQLSLINAAGKAVALSDLRGQRVIVYFFPKAFTPGCTTEVCDFRDHREALAAEGYMVLGISADPPKRLAEFRDAHQVNHDLLSDPGYVAARRWGAYGPKAVNGEPTTGPLRSTFVIDADGILQSVEYQLDPNQHVSALLDQVRS